MVVHLPNFHQGVALGISFDVSDFPAQVGNCTNRWGERIIYDNEVIIGVQEHFVRIKGPSVCLV